MNSVKKCTENKQTYFFTTNLKNKAPWRFLPDTSSSKINACKKEAQNLKETLPLLHQKISTVPFIRMLIQENLNIIYRMCDNEL